MIFISVHAVKIDVDIFDNHAIYLSQNSVSSSLLFVFATFLMLHVLH